MIAGSALGVGLFVGLFAYLFWHKGKYSKLVDILALIAGLCVAGSVASFLGLGAGWSMFGVGLGGFTLLLLVWFVLEFRGHGRHGTRTPILGVLLGIALMAGPIGGPLRSIAQNIEQSVVTHVQNANVQNINLTGTNGKHG
jgi:hypothetical protein